MHRRNKPDVTGKERVFMRKNTSESSEMISLIVVLKNLMKREKVRYSDLVPILNLSEASIKRIFSRQSLSIPQMVAICRRLGVSFFEVTDIAAKKFAPTHEYTEAQDRLLGQDPVAMYIFIRLLITYSPEEIRRELDLSSHELFKILRKLDDVGLIECHEGNKVILRAKGPFKFPKGGHLDKGRSRHLKFVFSHFQSNARNLTEGDDLIHTREFYLPDDILAQFKKDLEAISLKYRQLNYWIMYERPRSDLNPVTALLCLGKFNAFKSAIE